MTALAAYYSGINIRKAGVEDIDAIYHLVKEAFANYVQRGENPVENEGLNDIKGDLLNNLVMVIEYQKEIVGSLRLESQLESSIYLKRFSISPLYQKKGLGTILYQEAEKYVRSLGARFIYLNSSLENKRLVKFYNKLGFTCLKADYQNGYQRGLWVKKIDGVE